MAAIISKFSNIKETTGGKDIELDVFLDYIQEGFWQDDVLKVRTTTHDKKLLTEAKAKLPYVTISGKFSRRSNDSLIKHSGFLALDMDPDDNPNILEKRDTINGDKYVHSGFISSSGRGYCVLIKIEPGKHLEAFAGAEEYFFKNYDVILDTGCKDVSRPRYVSYDPELYRADSCERFKEYPKEKPPKRIDTIVFAKDDFEEIVKQIVSKGLNIVDSYWDWMRTGFAFAEKFNEAGRHYFHLISQASSKYNPRQADRQYDHCLRNLGSSGKTATMAVFYYLCKSAGLSLYSERTKTIVNAAVQGKKGGRNAEQVARALADFEDIQDAAEIIAQVYGSDIEGIGEDSIIDQVLLYLKHNHSLRKNEITRYFEDNGKPLEQTDLNGIFLNIKRVYEKASFEIVERIINSPFTPVYNPLKDYFEGNRTTETGFIDALADTIVSEDYLFTRHFFKKWLVGSIASVYGEHSPLMFILSGPVHGKGKTEFYRRMMPAALKPYFADISPGMKDTDFHILMTQKLFLLDDECGNKTKRDDLALKSLLSKQEITVREPYGRNNVTLMRIANFGGTTNEDDLISDIDNRRLVAIYYFSHDFDKYNAIDKDKLFAEAYELFRTGYNWRLTSEDKAWLNAKSGRFQKFTAEYELLIKYFRKPNPGEENYLSATEIKNLLETKSVQKIQDVNKVGKELKRIGYACEIRKINGSSKRAYNIVELSALTPPAKIDEDYDF